MLHINFPNYTRVEKYRNKCPDCKKRTYKLARFQEWYGWYVTCLNCGREWQNNEWLPLDFYRGVRKNNIDKAKKIWNEFNEKNK